MRLLQIAASALRKMQLLQEIPIPKGYWDGGSCNAGRLLRFARRPFAER